MRIRQSLRSAPLVIALASACAVAVTGGCSSASTVPPAISLSADAQEVPADGVSSATFTAVIDNAAPNSVVSFDVQGTGLLSATNAHVVNGTATVQLYAPFEAELAPSNSAQSTVTAHLTADDNSVVSSAVTVSFTVPTVGAPVITAFTTPDRVVAGGTDSITIQIDGKRLTSGVVTLTTASSAITVPASLTLDAVSPAVSPDQGGGLFHGALVIPPPAAPADVTVRVTAEGAAPVDVFLRFIAADAPAFDLSGTFAQVGYSVVQIGGLFFLDPDPQCVVAPHLSLVHITQDGNHLTVADETCDIQMPSVNVIFVGTAATTVGPGFVAASNNARGNGPLDFTLDDVSAGAPYVPPPASYAAPHIVGCALASPDDALPTAPDDARVRDDDNDGHPGVTITNSAQGDQFIVFRSRVSSIAGTIESSDLVTGMVAASTESNILNGGGITPTVTDEPSPFFMRRVDGRNGAPDISSRDGDPSSISCADVKAYAAELMAESPAPSTTTACQ